MADEISLPIAEWQKMVNTVSTLEKQYKSTGKGVHNFGVQLGVVEKAQTRLNNIWAGSVFGKLQVMGQWLNRLGKVTNEYSNNLDDMAEAENNLTAVQKHLMVPLLKTTAAAKLGQGMWEKYRGSIVNADGSTNLFRATLLSIGSSIMTLLGILGIIGFALAIFSLSTQGATSPLVTMTEHIPILGEAMKGLAALLTEGEASWQQYATGGVLLAIAALTLLPGILGPIVVAFILARKVYKSFVDDGKSGNEALLASIGVFAVSLFALLNPARILKWGLRILMHLGKLLGIGGTLILAGLGLLLLSATGKIKGWMGVLAAVVGAGLVYIGLLFLQSAGVIGATILGIPFFWVAAILLMVALIVRYRKQIIAAFIVIKDKLIEIGKAIGMALVKQILFPLRAALTLYNKLTGKGGDLLKMLGGGVFGIEARAAGGPVRGGRSYLVGERGPELFTPTTSGSITPNHELGGGVTNNISLSIDVGGVTDRTDKRALARDISAMLNEELRRLGGSPTRGRY